MATEYASVRYIVNDVQESIDFYCTHLGFQVLNNAAPAFADVARGNLRLLLSGPLSSAARPMPDGRQPVAGGWNRIHLVVDNIEPMVNALKASGAIVFRNDIMTGPGGSQIVFDDPSGNAIELFQPAGAPPAA